MRNIARSESGMGNNDRRTECNVTLGRIGCLQCSCRTPLRSIFAFYSPSVIMPCAIAIVKTQDVVIYLFDII